MSGKIRNIHGAYAWPHGLCSTCSYSKCLKNTVNSIYGVLLHKHIEIFMTVQTLP